MYYRKYNTDYIYNNSLLPKTTRKPVFKLRLQNLLDLLYKLYVYVDRFKA